MDTSSRKVALEILERVLDNKIFLDTAFVEVTERYSRDDGDNGDSEIRKPWIRDVTSGVMRWKGRLDLLIDRFAKARKPEGRFRKMLYLGAYQILYQDSRPKPLVVDEVVESCKTEIGEAPANFINAFLRDLIRNPPKSPTKPFSQWWSLPNWLWKSCVSDFDIEWAKAFAEASLVRPRNHLVGLSSLDLEGVENGPLEGSYIDRRSGDFTSRSGFKEGDYFAQDISNQLLVREIASRLKNEFGENASVLDYCAAPGGKSFHLAKLGFKVKSTDSNKRRLKLVGSALDRLSKIRDRVEVISYPPPESNQFDFVWADAPCSATGTLRKSPEIRWIRESKDVESLCKLQREIIDQSWKLVRPGGFFAYSVCSLLKVEGNDHFFGKNKLPSGAAGAEVFTYCPQTPPHGDGIWCALIRKSDIL